MIFQAPDLTAVVAGRGGVTRNTLMLGLLLLTFPLAGCSAAIYGGYLASGAARGYYWAEVTALETRAAVLDKLGGPAQVLACQHGRRLERYSLPAKMDPRDAFQHASQGVTPLGVHGDIGSLWSAGSGKSGAPLLFHGLAEVALVPSTIANIYEAEQRRGRLHVAFVYGPEDRLLYSYDAAPGDAEGMVLGPLTQQVRDASDRRCFWWRDCVAGGVAEMRRVAACLDHTLTMDAVVRVAWAERIAELVDAGRLSREAGREALEVCYFQRERRCPLRRRQTERQIGLDNL